eukprot:c6130_g1_i1.p1 GENE.c6130_g1_i1~~c6130_g1_i1.p1  ORF type:complete len:604 (+),score=130.21 c6130_g1_i1:35-1846(+)
MRVVVVIVCLFLVCDPIWAQADNVTAMRTSAKSGAPAIDATLLTQGASILINRLRNIKKQVDSKRACPEGQVSIDENECGCAINTVMIDDKCVPCPANSGTDKVGGIGWSDCLCNRGHSGTIRTQTDTCQECGVDQFGAQGLCFPCPALSSTDHLTGQSICKCDANYYSSVSECVACPVNSTSPVGSKRQSQCECFPGHVRDLVNGSIACVPEEDPSRSPLRRALVDNVFSQTLLKHGLKEPVDTMPSCPSDGSCVSANMARVGVRWLQVIVSTMSQVIALFFRGDNECPTGDITTILFSSYINVVDICFDAVGAVLGIAAIHMVLAFFVVGTGGFDWATSLDYNRRSKYAIVLVSSGTDSDSKTEYAMNVDDHKCRAKEIEQQDNENPLLALEAPAAECMVVLEHEVRNFRLAYDYLVDYKGNKIQVANDPHDTPVVLQPSPAKPVAQARPLTQYVKSGGIFGLTLIVPMTLGLACLLIVTSTEPAELSRTVVMSAGGPLWVLLIQVFMLGRAWDYRLMIQTGLAAVFGAAMSDVGLFVALPALLFSMVVPFLDILMNFRDCGGKKIFGIQDRILLGHVFPNVLLGVGVLTALVVFLSVPQA